MAGRRLLCVGQLPPREKVLRSTLKPSSYPLTCTVLTASVCWACAKGKVRRATSAPSDRHRRCPRPHRRRPRRLPVRLRAATPVAAAGTATLAIFAALAALASAFHRRHFHYRHCCCRRFRHRHPRSRHRPRRRHRCHATVTPTSAATARLIAASAPPSSAPLLDPTLCAPPAAPSIAERAAAATEPAHRRCRRLSGPPLASQRTTAAGV